MDLQQHLDLSIPLIQAPMAGVSTPEMAAAVCNAGALGSIGVGATDAAGARVMVEQLREQTARAFNVNLFVHEEPRPDSAREQAWLEALRPIFAEFDAAPPNRLRTIYRSFADDPDMLGLLLATRPRVVSFHFGLPSADILAALRAAGCLLMATATSLAEALMIENAGIDVIIAQGIEAGGHRGIFDPDGPDDMLGTFALTRLLVRRCRRPVVAAGGIMDGAGLAAALDLGAAAGQMGTAFIACPESAADAAYRAALMGPAAAHTRLTALISGRPARTLANRFSALEARLGHLDLPAYPIAYDAGKALNAAAKPAGEHGFGAQWAGQGAPLARAMPAASLIEAIRQELEACGHHGQTREYGL